MRSSAYQDGNKAIPQDPYALRLGRIVEVFAVLDDQVSAAVSLLLGVSGDVGSLVTAEMPFRNKLNLMGALARQRALAAGFSIEPEKGKGLEQILQACLQCEELQRRAIESSWRCVINTGLRQRVPVTQAGFDAAQGERVSAERLVEIGDMIVRCTECLEHFFSAIEQSACEVVAPETIGAPTELVTTDGEKRSDRRPAKVQGNRA